MIEDLQNQVTNHDRQLVRIETILERVAQNQDSTSTSLASIAQSLSKIARLEDKISTLDEKQKLSFERVHGRIDSEIEIRETGFKHIWTVLKSLDLFSFMGRHPKIATFVFIGMYTLAFYDVRQAISDKFDTFTNTNNVAITRTIKE